MEALWATIKEWAMKPVFGVPLFAIVGVAAAAAFMLLRGKKGRRGGMFRR